MRCDGCGAGNAIIKCNDFTFCSIECQKEFNAIPADLTSVGTFHTTHDNYYRAFKLIMPDRLIKEIKRNAAYQNQPSHSRIR